MTFEEIKELGIEGQELARKIYAKGALDFYYHTKCMSEKEKEVYARSFQDE